jgi:N-acetylneuraminic acid mutarotase
MRTFIITLSSFLFSLSSAHAQDVWTQKDSVNGPPRSSCASFVLDGEGWVVSGLDIIDFNRKMYSYDIDQDDWDSEESIGGVNGSGLNRGGAIAFSADGKGFVGLGQGNTAPFYSDLWSYDPESTVWTQKADFIGSARRQAVAFTINDIAYVGTGQDQDGFTKDFYAYDATTNTWVQIADFGGTARKGAVGFTMGAQGYVGTGDDGIYTNDFWQYHPSFDVWAERASYPGTARTGASGWGIFPTAFITCGYDNTFSYKKDVWEYNYFGNVWVQRSNFTGPKRTNASAFVIDGIAYLGLGYNGEYLDDFYAYTPILSIQEDAIKIKMEVYPNPATTFVNIRFTEALPNDTKVILYDMRGKKVSTLDFDYSSNNIQINLNNLTAGAYFYSVQSKNTSFVKSGKLIIE